MPLLRPMGWSPTVLHLQKKWQIHAVQVLFSFSMIHLSCFFPYFFRCLLCCGQTQHMIRFSLISEYDNEYVPFLSLYIQSLHPYAVAVNVKQPLEYTSLHQGCML